MGARHFEGHLPDGVVFLEDDQLGTASGNPSTEAACAFMDDNQPPQYAVAYVVPRGDDDTSKHVVMEGPYDFHGYNRCMSVAGALGIDEAASRVGQDIDSFGLRSNVPRFTNTEAIIGAFAKLIFERH